MGLLGVDITLSRICFETKTFFYLFFFYNYEYGYFIWRLYNECVFRWFCSVEDIGPFEILATLTLWRLWSLFTVGI